MDRNRSLHRHNQRVKLATKTTNALGLVCLFSAAASFLLTPEANSIRLILVGAAGVALHLVALAILGFLETDK